MEDKYELPFLDSLLLHQAINSFMDSVRSENKSPKTVKVYEHNLKHFEGYAGNIKLIRIDAGLLRNYIEARGKAVAAVTAHQGFRVLRTFFKWCMREGFLENYPMANMKAPKVPKRIIPVFTKEQIHRLIAVCPAKKFKGSRNAAIISLYLDTGMRESELTNLKLKDVDFHSGSIKVFGKGSKERIVHMNDKARQSMRRYMMLRDYKLREKGKEQKVIFLSEELRPLTEDGLRTIFRKICKEAGVEGHIHMLRHTFAIEYLRAGGDLTTLQKTLGHEDIATTTIYLTALNADDVIAGHQRFSPGDRFL